MCKNVNFLTKCARRLALFEGNEENMVVHVFALERICSYVQIPWNSSLTTGIYGNYLFSIGIQNGSMINLTYHI